MHRVIADCQVAISDWTLFSLEAINRQSQIANQKCSEG
jgi:hypothetical protein